MIRCFVYEPASPTQGYSTALKKPFLLLILHSYKLWMSLRLLHSLYWAVKESLDGDRGHIDQVCSLEVANSLNAECYDSADLDI